MIMKGCGDVSNNSIHYTDHVSYMKLKRALGEGIEQASFLARSLNLPITLSMERPVARKVTIM